GTTWVKVYEFHGLRLDHQRHRARASPHNPSNRTIRTVVPSTSIWGDRPLAWGAAPRGGGPHSGRPVPGLTATRRVGAARSLASIRAISRGRWREPDSRTAPEIKRAGRVTSIPATRFPGSRSG